MSVGGKVVDIVDAGDKVWVNTREPYHGRECAIYVERTYEALSVSVGDSLWWQGAKAYWTPRTGSFKKDPPFIDKALRRVGFSGVPRPE